MIGPLPAFSVAGWGTWRVWAVEHHAAPGRAQAFDVYISSTGSPERLYGWPEIGEPRCVPAGENWHVGEAAARKELTRLWELVKPVPADAT